MRGALRRALVAASSMVLVGAMAIPSFAAGASDPTNTTIEPILTRSDALVSNPTFRTSALNEINITSFDVTASGGFITARATTAANIMRCASATGCTATPQAPYGGGHIMVMFETDSQGQLSQIGCADLACSGQNNWTPRSHLDGWKWFVTFGVSASGLKETVDVGMYDPSGRLVGAPLEPGIGQTFGVLAQQSTGLGCPAGSGPTGTSPGPSLAANTGHNVTWSFPTPNTIEWKIPYTLVWRVSLDNAASCMTRSKPVVSLGSGTANQIRNAVAFSWADHEIGGPEPVGLILGWTWYTDSVPAVGGTGGYKVGTPAGDPNPARFAGPTCPFTLRSVGPVTPGQVNPLWNPSAACMIPNPVGPGFNASGIGTNAT